MGSENSNFFVQSQQSTPKRSSTRLQSPIFTQQTNKSEGCLSSCRDNKQTKRELTLTQLSFDKTIC